MNHYLGFRKHDPGIDPPVPRASNLARVCVLQDHADATRIAKLVDDVRKASRRSTATKPPMQWPVNDAIGGEVLIWMALQDTRTNRSRFFLRHQRLTLVVDIELDLESHRQGASGKCLLHRLEKTEGSWAYGLCLFHHAHGDAALGSVVVRRSPARLRVYSPRWAEECSSSSTRPVLVRLGPTRFAIRNQQPFVALRYDKSDFTLRDKDGVRVRAVGPRRHRLAHGVVYYCRASDHGVIRAAQACRPALGRAAAAAAKAAHQEASLSTGCGQNCFAFRSAPGE